MLFNKIKMPLVVLAMVVLQYSFGYGQDTTVHVVQDLESWSSAKFKYKFSKKFSVGLSESLRLRQNSSVIDQHFTELSAGYRLFKPLTLVAEGRYGFRNRDDAMKRSLRMFYGLDLEKEFGDLELSARLAFQSRNDLSGESVNAEPKRTLRYRLGAGYNIKNWKLDPAVSFEMFRETWVDEPEFDKFRLKIHTDYSLKKAGKLRFFYAYESELKDNFPQKTSIVGVNYSFTAKRKKPKKD